MPDRSETPRVLLTGGATGIGAATAARLAAAGAGVTILDVAEPDHGAGAFVRCDLSDPAAIDAALETQPGPWSALVNVAGIPGPRPAEPVIRVNFLGPRHLTERLLPRMARGGSVVNVASTGFWGRPISPTGWRGVATMVGCGRRIPTHFPSSAWWRGPTAPPASPGPTACGSTR
jgi:NAD(P)-dependent dehydrogenase (short-subunit alcohol dehydrogenase family)